MRFVVENDRLPKTMAANDTKYVGVKSASDNTLAKLTVDLKNGTIKQTDSRATDPKVWRAIINGMST